MPAKIVQNNSKKFNRVKLDPITLDVIENSMFSARWEMDAVLFRTAMSPGIREQGDEFPMIANLDGKMVVGQFGSFIHGFKEAFDGTIEEGDMFLTMILTHVMVRSVMPMIGYYSGLFSRMVDSLRMLRCLVI